MLINRKLGWLMATLFTLFNGKSFAQLVFHLRGYVYESTNPSQPLLHAHIKLSSSGEIFFTNEYGYFTCTAKEDTIRLEISYVGFVSEIHQLVLTKDTLVKFYLREESLQEVVVTASGLDVSQRQTGLIQLSKQQMKYIPTLGGEPDPIKALSLMPGVSTGTEGTSGLFVRGGTPDQNLVLIDGTPVYNLAHLYGFISIFNYDALAQVNLYKSGFPARFGGRASGITEIITREGNNEKTKGTVRLGLLNSSLALDGPLKRDRSAYMLSLRSSYLPAIFGLVSAVEPGYKVIYALYDLNAKVRWSLNDEDQLYLSVYHGNDILSTKEDYGYIDKFKLQWGNTTWSVRYKNVMSKQAFNQVNLYFTQYHYGQEEYHFDPKVELGNLYENKSTLKSLGLNSRWDFLIWSNLTLTTGLGGELVQNSPGQSAYYVNDELLYAFKQPWPIKNAHVFLESEIKLLDGLKLDVGGRLGLYQVNKHNELFTEPRLTIKIEPQEAWRLSLHYTIMNQPLHLLTTSGAGLPNEVWVPATPAIAPVRAAQYGAGLMTKIGPVLFSVEGFNKKMHNLIEYKEGINNIFQIQQGWEQSVYTAGRGHVYGVETAVELGFKRIKGSVGYTWSRNFRQFTEINQNQKYPAKYDRIHDAETALNITLSPKWTLNSNVVYATGYAITLPVALLPNGVPIYTARNNQRAPDYFRWDVSITRIFTTRRRGRSAELTLGMYNVTGRKNPFYVSYSPNINRNYLGQINHINASLRSSTAFAFVPSLSYSWKL